MAMFSFRVEDDEAKEATRWAQRLGIDRFELFRDALRRYLVRLRDEDVLSVVALLGGNASVAAISSTRMDRLRAALRAG